MVSRPAARAAAAPPQQQQQRRRRKKKRKKPRKRRPYRRPRKKGINQLILQALSARKQRSGLSLASLREALLANGYDVEKNKTRLRMAVRGLVLNGSLVQTKGRGRGAATAGYLKLSQRPVKPQQPRKTRRKTTTTTRAAVPKPRAGAKAKKETNKKKCRTKTPPKKRAAVKASPRKTKPKPKKTRK